MPMWCFGPAIRSASTPKLRRFGLMAQCCSIAPTLRSIGAQISNSGGDGRKTDMRTFILIATLILCVAVPAAAQTIAITNGTVYPVSGPSIPNTTVRSRDGAIVAVGTRVNVPADARRIDATGKVVTPGLINSVTELGVIEIDQGKETKNDTAKGLNNISAAFGHG